MRLIVLFTSTGVLASAGNWYSASSDVAPCLQDNSTNVSQSAASSGKSTTFSNQFLTIEILHGWAAHPVNQILDIVHGKYILSINPMFTHASGIIGGRFPEVTARMPSVNAVMRNVEQPAGGWECSQSDTMMVTSTMSLRNLYTDKSKTGNGCTFPLDPQSAWFGSLFVDRASESEYSITLSYNITDVNKLPKRDSQELRRIFRDVVAMLKALTLKPPVVIAKVDPEAAPPGAMVTIYGSGFRIPNYHAILILTEFPNNPMPEPTIAPDGNSMTFLVPSSINTISCQPGYIDVNENCVPTPADHVDINDCPQSVDFCGMPIPSGSYHIMINLVGTGVISNSLSLTVAPSAPTPVSILLLYPNQLVSPGDVITIRGSGFAPTDNTVEIGSAVINNLSSADGKTITFQAPAPVGESFIRGVRNYWASVSNANGKSNSISFDYR
ncbi:MAG TPA: IPT/TIG domain-containing protein [Candidatus Acidoferrum sp.]